MNYKILILIALVASVLLSGCLNKEQIQDSIVSTPKYHVGDSITSSNTLFGGNITNILNGKYVLDDGMEVNTTEADSGWSNTTKKYVPKFKVGDRVLPNGNIKSRYIITEINLNSGRYTVSYILNNVTSSDTISNVDGYPKGDIIHPKFKQGNYIYSLDSLEYSKVTNAYTENETYFLIYPGNKTGTLDFADDYRYNILNPHTPPNGLYLYKDSMTGLRFIYNEFDNKGYFVIMNMKSGEITKVEQVTRVIYRNSGSSNNKGYNDGDMVGAAVIGFALGISI